MAAAGIAAEPAAVMAAAGMLAAVAVAAMDRPIAVGVAAVAPPVKEVGVAVRG
jgi:hypothetical protein